MGGPPAADNRAAEPYVGRLEALGAHVVETAIPDPPADTWPLFFHEAAEAHRATFPARADEYGENVRVKLEEAQTVEPAEVEARAKRCTWRTYRPEVDLYVAPVLGIDMPPATATSSRCGSPRRRSSGRSTCSAGRRSRSATCS